eukprot:1676599-Amphidinium_carterae.1
MMCIWSFCCQHTKKFTISLFALQFCPLGLPDEKKAFADAQELGAWTMGLLWSEVLNRIDR